jgi:alkanesulfonate monooxygenase SsuD/methylene tetrahydromethanopterin reductase-like flavin-dependent oxidoreductase (luciferase family)
MAATVDVISGGRLELGIGAGWNQEECDAYGIELGGLTERFDRFDEALECIVGLLTQENTDFRGRYFTLSDARNEPKPIQQPHPPIVIGGTGPRRTLRAVARHADHWNHPGADVEGWLASRAILHERCAEIERDPAEITTSIHLLYDPAGGPGPLVEQASAFAEAGLDLGIVYLPPPHDPAVLEPLAEALAPLT